MTPVHSPHDIRAVIFDLDGTLYHMKWFMRPLLFLRLFPNSRFLPLYMKVRKDFAGMDMQSGDTLMTALSESLGRQIRRSGEDARRWIEKAFYPAFIRIMPLMWSPAREITATVDTLSQRSIPCAVLSDFAMVPQRLCALGIDPRSFRIINSSETEGALKPHPRPFRRIAEKLELPPRHILVIGDRRDTDGEAAAAAGMNFLQITHSRRQERSIPRWSHIRAVLQDLR
jgi:FMN phosphatase YigB (HAD superfamily)